MLRMVDLSKWMDWSGLKGTQAWNSLNGGWVQILTWLLGLMMMFAIYEGWLRLGKVGRNWTQGREGRIKIGMNLYTVKRSSVLHGMVRTIKPLPHK
jgi:hypothetical protein